MFQRTIKGSYETQDCIICPTRQLLNSERDTQKIYYESVPNTSTPMEEPKDKVASTELKARDFNTTAPPATNKLAVDEGILSASCINFASDIDDRPIEAREILIAIVSKALKKPAPDIDVSKSLKLLAGGTFRATEKSHLTVNYC